MSRDRLPKPTPSGYMEILYLESWVDPGKSEVGCLRFRLLPKPEMQRQRSGTAAGNSEQRQSSGAAISCFRGMELVTSGSFNGVNSRWPADVKGKPGFSPGAPHP